MTRRGIALTIRPLRCTARGLAAAILLVGCYEPLERTTPDTQGDDSGSSGASDTDSGDPTSVGSTADSTADATAGSTASTAGSTASGATSTATTDDETSATDDGSDTTEDDGTSDTSTGAPADTTAPEVIAVSPTDGATGVRADANVVITFSEPMATAATAAAFASSDLGDFTASWNDDGTELTIDPDAPLAYAAGVDPADVVALAHAFTLGTGATDEAGNPLGAELRASFTTLRRITVTLASDAALTGAVLSNGALHTGAGGDAVAGDGTDNLQRKGFFAFHLEDVPAGAEVESATLVATQLLTLGTPFANPPSGFGTLAIVHVEADALDAAAYGGAALDDVGVFSVDDADGERTADVAAAVADDLDAARPRSQYRLEFGVATDGDGSSDRTRFQDSGVELVYLVE